MTTETRGRKPDHSGGLFDHELAKDKPLTFDEAVDIMFKTPATSLAKISTIEQKKWRHLQNNYRLGKMSLDIKSKLLKEVGFTPTCEPEYLHPFNTL